VLLAAGVVLLAGSGSGIGAPVPGSDVLYSLDADFDQGTRVNTNHNAPNSNQLQLNEQTETFPFIWVALSARGTIAKIDTSTGDILGEYSTTSDGDGSHNTSRTTVGLDGSVWAGNRNQSSAIHVGLLEANQCVDRNANGTIETSSGYGDVLPWPGGSGGNSSPVSSAGDECILHYVDTAGGDARHVSVDPDGDIWIASTGTRIFHEIDPVTGAVIRTAGPFSCGGYGGLVDGAGVIWSATASGAGVLRYDPDAAASATNPRCVPIANYGMAVDANGYVWVSTLGNGTVSKVAPDGSTWQTFGQGSTYAQGLAVDFNGDVWISSSLISGTTVSHLKNDGTFVGNVTISPANGPTGIAVDAAGKIWSANINSSDATRIDPAGGALGADGVTKIGAVDLTVPLPGASPYNYSDMTGALLLGSTSPQGTWTVTQDAGAAGTAWGKVVWNTEAQGAAPAGTSIDVAARAADSEAGLGGQAFVPVANGGSPGLTGRFIEVRVTLKPNEEGVSPVLSDIRICSTAASCAGGGPTPVSTPPADIGVSKGDAPDPVSVGSNLTYTLVVTNHGPGSAPGAAMTDRLPVGVTFLSVATTRGSCAFASGEVRCSFGTLALRESATVTIVVRVDQAGTLVNSAIVGTTVADHNVANNQTATAVTTAVGVFTPPAAPEVPVATGCGLTTGTPSVFAGVRSVVVVRARFDDGSARAGVAVTLRGAGKAQTARTNAAGIARFAVVPRQAGRITVRGVGCGSVLSVAAVLSQSCVGLSVTPKSAAVGDRAALSVRVRIAGKPAVGVRVLARGAGLALSARTDSAGVAVLRGTASRPGVVTITVPGVLACSKRVGVSGAFQPPEVTG
jgi:uncharacterized repeat protein (TIGR01451 family)